MAFALPPAYIAAVPSALYNRDILRLAASIPHQRRLETRALDTLRQALGIKVHLRVVEPRQIERSQGKAVRVVERHQVR